MVMTAQACINSTDIGYNLTYIAPNELGLYWKTLDFSKALDHAHMKPDDLYQILKEGKCDLFIARDTKFKTYGGLVLGIYQGFDGLFLEVICASGEGMNEWLEPLWGQVENIAKKTGCVRIKIIGRQGWKKVMKPFGFKQQSITLEKVL